MTLNYTLGVPDSKPSRDATLIPTSARLSLGRTQPTLSTQDHLRFQLDHALARDAVHTPLDIALLQRGLIARGLQPILLQSAASAAANGTDARKTYLRRPDLGRTLHPDSITQLNKSVILSEGAGPHPAPQSKDPETASPADAVPNLSTHEPPNRSRILFLLADGLSAQALERHALPLLDATLPQITNLYPLIPVLTNARVAIADEIGHLLHAQITVLLIGERPGLSSPDSLGVYITWHPRPGRTDAERNCISNIRGDAGLSYTEAAHRIAHYITEAQRLHTTGIALKDPTTLHLL